jgi:hypothetical protein
MRFEHSVYRNRFQASNEGARQGEAGYPSCCCIESVTLAVLPLWQPVPLYACFLKIASSIIAVTLFPCTGATFRRRRAFVYSCGQASCAYAAIRHEFVAMG